MKLAQSEVLKPESRAKWKDKFPAVSTPSVFDCMSSVVRLLTEEEVMDAYDVELNTQQELKEYWKVSKSKSTRSYTQQIPTKVLREVSLRLVKFLTSTLLIKSDESDINNCTSEIQSSLSRMSVDKNESEFENNKTDQIDDQKSIRERAACNDDAEAVPEDWDIWMVENFKEPKIKPIICTGVYNDKTHGPFFSLFRNLMMKRYRKNVLKSLLIYLKEEYWKGETSREFIDVKLGDHKNLALTLPRWIRHR